MKGRFYLFTILTTLIFSVSVFGGIRPGAVFEYRPTGNNLNGGGFDSTIAGAGTDYSLQGNYVLTAADLSATQNEVTVNTVLGTFTAAMVGNCVQITAGSGGTQTGYYFITSYLNSKQVKFDRSPASGSNATGMTGYCGGAWASPTDGQFEAGVSGNIYYLRGAGVTYTLTGAISVASTAANGASPIRIVGYNTVRTDNPTGTNRPIIACGSNGVGLGANWRTRNIIVTSTKSAATGWSAGNYGHTINCKFTNSAANTSSAAMTIGASGQVLMCQLSCPSGNALVGSTGTMVYKSYIHDSKTGFTNATNNGSRVIKSVFSGNGTDVSLPTGTGTFTLINCIFYGAGTGISIGQSSMLFLGQNIFHSKTTALTDTAQNDGVFAQKNLFYNCGTNATNVTLDSTNIIGQNPLFTSPATGDFTLSSNLSPCINAGFDIGSYSGLTGSYKPQIGVDEDNNTRITHSFAR